MNMQKPPLTATHYAAASFAAAIFSMVAVLAVIGGTVRGETEDADEAPTVSPPEAPVELSEAPLATESEPVEVETVAELEDADRPMRRGPGRRPGPPSFDDIDANGDNSITREEFEEFTATRGPRGPRGVDEHARGEFDGPPRGPRGPHGDFRGGPDRGPGRGGPGEFRGGPGGDRGRHGPPPHTRGRGGDEFRGGPGHSGRGGDEFRGGPGGDRGRHGPPPHMRGRGDDDFRGGPRRGGPGEFRGGPRGGAFGQRPPRPEFEAIDGDGDGSISKQEFEDFHPPRGPRPEEGDMPGKEDF